MALVLERQDGGSGSWLTVDQGALGLHGIKLKLGYSHGWVLTFTATAANHTFPLDYQDFIRLYDDAGQIDGSDQDGSNPLFEGWVEEVTPGSETNKVEVTCYDATVRAAKYVNVMSLPWTQDGSDPPEPDADAYPRFVCNVYNDNDDDFIYSQIQLATLGQIIAWILDDQNLPLRFYKAGPASGGDPMYDDAELGAEGTDLDSDSVADWTGGLDFKPQDKFVSHSEAVRGCLERLLQTYDPATKLYLEPGTRVWRFVDLKDSPEVTITVNKDDDTYGTVLSLDIRRSAEGRYGAVKFFGPEGVEWRTADWGVNTVDTLESARDLTVGTTPNDYTCYQAWQITDGAFTRIARRGPYQIYVPGQLFVWSNADGSMVQDIATTLVQTWSPSFQIAFPDSTGGGPMWRSLKGWWCNWRTGLVDFGETCPVRWEGVGNGFAEPDQVQFIYPAVTTPLTVRYPSTPGTYAGTAYSVGGFTNELRLYDEALAVGYEYGTPVTTSRRLAKYAMLAAQIHRQRKDLIYAGTIVLDGMQYEFARLNRRVNIAAVDDDGDELVTGWEEVGAIVTDVEFDFTEQTTTVTFSSDQMEVLGLDMEQMKARLKIRPAEKVMTFTWSAALFTRQVRTWTGVRTISGFRGTVSRGSEWRDEFGELQ